jgi:hypothetical protein
MPPPASGSKNKASKNPARKQVANLAGILLGLFFDPETLVDFQWTKWSYIPEDITLHNHCHENLKSYKPQLNCHIVIAQNFIRYA